MPDRLSTALRAGVTELTRLPRGAQLGLTVIVIGLGLDLVAHGLGGGGVVSGEILAGRHTAHFVVLVGMVITLAGVVHDGVRRSGRGNRPERSISDAVR